MTKIQLHNGSSMDCSQINSETMARIIWQYGLANKKAYDQLKKELPFDHLALQIASDLNQAHLLYQGTLLDFDDYHTTPHSPHADFSGLINGNQTLFKMITDWTINSSGRGGFLQQITDFTVRPTLRYGVRGWAATHKLDLRTNQIIPYRHNRHVTGFMGKKNKTYTKTKKQSATLLSKNLHTGVYSPGVGLLFDESKCDIRAMYTMNATTVAREWVGSFSSVQNYQLSHCVNGALFSSRLYTDRKSFRNYVDLPSSTLHNEVLAKFSRESILGVFIVGDTAANRLIAIERQIDLVALFKKVEKKDIHFPIFIYDNTLRTIRIYTTQEQANDVARYNILEHENNHLTTIQNLVHQKDLKALKLLFQNNPSRIKQGFWLFDAIGPHNSSILKHFFTKKESQKKIDLFNYLLTLPGIRKEQKKGDQQETPLVFATRGGKKEFVEILLTHGVDMNSQDIDGNTALMIAVHQNDIEMTQLLLKYHPDLKLKNTKNNSVYAIAIHQKNLNLLKVLYAAQKNCPLILFTTLEEEELVDYALKQGENVNVQDENQETALMHAIKRDHINIFNKILTQKIDFSLRNNQNETALFLAIKMGRVRMVGELLRRYPNLLQERFLDNQSPVMFAIRSKNMKMVQCLLKYTQDWHHVDDHGESALTLACPDKSMLALLLRCGCHLDDEHTDGATPLILVSNKPNNAVSIETLIMHGADAGRVDDAGENALMHAVRAGHLGNVQKLLSLHDYDLNQENNTYQTAIAIAIDALDENNSPEILETLLLFAAGEDDEHLFLDSKTKRQLQKIFVDLFHSNQIDGMIAFLLLDIHEMILHFDPEHVEAIDAATELYHSLKKSFFEYRQSIQGCNDEERPKALNVLFDEWEESIHVAKRNDSELAHHRGWLFRDILGKLLFLISTLGTVSLYIGIKTGFHRFFPNTRSVYQLEDVEKTLHALRATPLLSQ